MRPHRRHTTRLPRPWDSPGKNTGVGCHFLLQCMKVKSKSEVAQSCPTLSDPMDCGLPGSSVHGIFQARVLEWVASAFSKLLSYQTKTTGFLSIPFISFFFFFAIHQVFCSVIISPCFFPVLRETMANSMLVHLISELSLKE